MAPHIYWVGGGKGGVGKSMVSMALLDHLLARDVPALFVDSDTSNPDVHKAYRDALPCERIDLDHVNGWMDPAREHLRQIVGGFVIWPWFLARM